VTYRLSHAALLFVLGDLALFGGLLHPILYGGGILLMLLGGVVVVWILREQGIDVLRARTEWVRALALLSPEKFDALGIEFPTLRIRWTGELRKCFEDTDIPIRTFERFIRDSNNYQISPERNWSGGTDRSAWGIIKNWLETHGHIFPDSAAGSHSWRWRGDAYNRLWRMYLPGDALVANHAAVQLTSEPTD
jgi:hypothetical protein